MRYHLRWFAGWNHWQHDIAVSLEDKTEIAARNAAIKAFGFYAGNETSLRETFKVLLLGGMNARIQVLLLCIIIEGHGPRGYPRMGSGKHG